MSGSVPLPEGADPTVPSSDRPQGRPGRPFNWRSPFFIGVTATAGVAVTYGAIHLAMLAGGVLVLIGLALFLAVGMEPLVSWLVRHGFRRGWAVLTTVLLILGVLGGFLAAAIPVIVHQGEQLAADVPGWLQRAQDHQSWLGRLNDRFDLTAKAQTLLSDSGSTLVDGVVGISREVFSVVGDSLIVLVLTVYFLADLPRLRALAYRLVPGSRRPRAVLLGDDIMAKVGGYVLGNLVISLVAGVLTFIWLIAWGVPYALLLSIAVALLDLIPVIGSTIAGALVALVALTVSVPVALATVAYFVVYRLAEDYLLIPRIIGRTVHVPAMVTVVAVLIGGALLGIVGALVAIPIAAAVLLLVRELLLPRLDRA
ncbi:AI-2E family transporter [Nakamurella leprariae]|uniref:AI-2E family transporter n=1 Tax=Nakamurella leprariae TaxID=2803911 RepID=A0A938YHF2_9ACTN|nr:AI-2E family transporter [Nakamurella leprariae]MBM9468412.1 AI-2E family transporter [Nakamurella leprariae]